VNVLLRLENPSEQNRTVAVNVSHEKTSILVKSASETTVADTAAASRPPRTPVREQIVDSAVRSKYFALVRACECGIKATYGRTVGLVQQRAWRI
jgi:hypothetical protein